MTKCLTVLGCFTASTNSNRHAQVRIIWTDNELPCMHMLITCAYYMHVLRYMRPLHAYYNLESIIVVSVSWLMPGLILLHACQGLRGWCGNRCLGCGIKENQTTRRHLEFFWSAPNQWPCTSCCTGYRLILGLQGLEDLQALLMWRAHRLSVCFWHSLNQGR